LTSPAELILVDDASKEFDLTNVPLPVVGKVIRMAENGGFSQACNAGATQATGDILLFLNSDTVAHDGWYEPLMAAFEPDVAIVGLKLVFPANAWCPICRVYYDKSIITDGKCPVHKDTDVEMVETIQSAGGLYDAGKGPYHRFFTWRADDPRVNIQEEVSWTTGAAFAIRADVFKAAGGFDAVYGTGYFEDVDISVKVRQAGWKIMYVPQACFTHFVAQSTSSDGRSDIERRLHFRANSRLFHLRWDAAIRVDTPSARFVDY
jgi:GT2 family glycosyltransferase